MSRHDDGSDIIGWRMPECPNCKYPMREIIKRFGREVFKCQRCGRIQGDKRTGRRKKNWRNIN